MVGPNGYFQDIPHPYKFWQRWMLIACSGAAVKAGQNTYHLTGDMKQAAAVSAEALARWALWCWAWLFAAMATGWSLLLWRTGLVLGVWSPAWWGYITAPLLIITWPLWFGVTWCRNVDFCLFRRGPLYRLFQPLAVATERHASGLFYGIVACGVGMTLVEWFSYLSGAWYH
jgi:hypothetical protein